MDSGSIPVGCWAVLSYRLSYLSSFYPFSSASLYRSVSVIKKSFFNHTQQVKVIFSNYFLLFLLKSHWSSWEPIRDLLTQRHSSQPKSYQAGEFASCCHYCNTHMTETRFNNCNSESSQASFCNLKSSLGTLFFLLPLKVSAIVRELRFAKWSGSNKVLSVKKLERRLECEPHFTANKN